MTGCRVAELHITDPAARLKFRKNSGLRAPPENGKKITPFETFPGGRSQRKKCGRNHEGIYLKTGPGGTNHTGLPTETG